MNGSGSVDGPQRPQDINIGSPSTNEAEHLEQLKRIASGNMDGDNLVIWDYNADGIADADIIGSRPTLSPPGIEPTIANYQKAIEQLRDVDAKTTEHAMMKVLEERLGTDKASDIALQPVPPISHFEETNTTMTAALGNENTFHADFSKGQMTVMMGDHRADFMMNDGNPTVTVDGQPVQFGSSELGALSDFFVLMELFHEMGVSQRQMSREARNAANTGVVKNIKLQAEEQKKAAVSQLVAGVVSGTVKMASAGLSMVGAVKGMRADKATALQDPNAQSHMFQGNMISQKFQAVGTVFESVGEVGASGARYQAAQHESQQTTLRAGEEQIKHVKQTEQDQMQVAQDLLNKARETFAQVWAQIIQTQQNLARNI